MLPDSPWLILLLVAALALTVNLPLGYLRAGVRKFSVAWFVYVHLSIPLIIFLRLRLGISFAWAPLFIFAAVIGQLVGGRWRRGKLGTIDHDS